MQKTFLSIHLLVLVTSLGFSIYNIKNFRLLHDENYVLARANGNSLNPSSIGYPFKLREEVVPILEIIKISNKNFSEINPILDSLNYLKNFHLYSNHPPINALLAKIFILKKSSIINIRYYAFTCFIFLLTSIFYLMTILRLDLATKLSSLAIFSSMSLSNFSSFFPKGYSLASGFLILSLSGFYKFLTEEKKRFFILAFIFSHLTMLTHYFTGITCLILICSMPIIINKSLDKLKYCFILGISFIPYIPLYKLQVQGSNSFFDKHLGLHEVHQSIKNLIHMMSFNYREPYDLIIFSVICVILILFLRQRIYNNKLFFIIVVCLSTFILFPTLDLIFDKHIISIIRYQLLAFPFFAILLALSLEKKPFILISIIYPLILINLFNPTLQKHTSILNSAKPYIKLGSSFNVNQLKKKTLFITKEMYGEELTFIQYLSNKILGQHQLEEINYETCKKLGIFHNIFFANRRINPEILEKAIKEYKIEQIYILGKDIRVKIKTEVPKYLIKI
jgi:hypothetical protein